MAEHTLVIPYASIEAGPAIPAGSRVIVQAELSWGRDVLGVAHVRPRDVLTVGDLGLDVPGGEAIVVARGETLVLPGGKDVPAGSRMTLRLGRTMLRVSIVADDAVVVPRTRGDARVALGIVAAAALHVAVLGALHHGRASDATLEENERATLARYMAAAEARADQEAGGSAPVETGAHGSLASPAPAERGMAGNPAQTRTDRARSAAKGAEPKAQKPGAEEVTTFGLLALLGADGDRAGTSAFAADTGRSAMGNIFGTAVGDAEGFGAVDLSGTGAGGGGKGAGVSLSGIGVGKGNGFGVGGIGIAGGRLIAGTHQVKAAVCRCGETQVNGRLPPEAIQRVVRASFGRFRACYEQGLARDPSLQGTVEVKFVIGRSGAVEMASATGDVPDRNVASCIGKRFEQLSFPEPTGGIVTVVYPLTLTPN